VVQMASSPAQLKKTEAARVRILQAARDVVALDGWQDAQIALIAHKADVATGSIYRHFESKADLYAQVLAMVSEREVAVVAAIADSEGPAAQRLIDCITAFSLRAMRGRRLAYAMIAEPCEPAINAARLKYRVALADQIARVIQQGIATGEFIDVDVHLAASCVTGAFMEGLVGPLAPELAPDSKAAKNTAHSIASMSARMLFKQLPPSLTLVEKGSK
jgi:AcrR family transcriptional regulator